jgi:hypothetical protein
VGGGRDLSGTRGGSEARRLLDWARMKPHALDRSHYSTLLLGRVAAGWRRLAEDERYGIVSAAHVAADLAALDAPAAILAMAGRVVQDEIHHLEVCARVLEELEPAARVSARIECAIPRPSPDESVLARTLVTEFAIGKPVTAAAFAAARALVREPLFGWAYTELLHDETRHATFGARAAAWVIRNWSTLQRQALWTECLTQGAPTPSPRPRDTEAEELGLLPGEVDCTLQRWILPHLAPLGIHPRPANAQVLVH